MCNPMAIGAVIAVVGAGLSAKANSDRREDMQRLQRRETERQDNLYKESAGALKENRDSYTREAVEQKMDQAATERQAQYAKSEAEAPRANEATAAGGGTSGNVVVLDAFRRAMEGSNADATRQGQLRSQIAAFGDAMGESAIEANRRTNQIGMLGSFMRGSAGVIPLELQSAMTRQSGTGTAGGMMQAFGSAMMSGGGGAAGSAGGAAAGGSSAPVDFSSLFASNRSANFD